MNNYERKHKPEGRYSPESHTKYSPEINKEYTQKHLDDIEKQIEQHKNCKAENDLRVSNNEQLPLKIDSKGSKKYQPLNPSKSYKAGSIYSDVTPFNQL